jgi:PPM family protein phosphatase
MSAASIPEAVAISFAAQCDCGRVRTENQDSVHQCATPLGDLLIVADGIGGYEGGGVASRMAVEVISASLEGMPGFFPIDIAIEEAVCRANAEIAVAAAEPGTPNNHMGTTVVLALLRQDPGNAHAPIQAWIGHIGDSRAYLLHHRRLTCITRDHSAIQILLDRNLITPGQARNHPDASVLTRALGYEPDVKIDLNSIELESGDTLLLCSDGLWGYVADEEIERVLADPELTAEQVSRALLDLALDAGGADNVGLQVARVAGTGAAAALREPAPAFEPELRFPYPLTSRLPELSAASSALPEVAPLAQPAAAAPVDVPTAPAVPPARAPAAPPIASWPDYLALPPEIPAPSAPEPVSALTAEPEFAPPAIAGLSFEPALRLESTPDRQIAQEQIPSPHIEPLISEPLLVAEQPAPVPAVGSPWIAELERLKTMLAIFFADFATLLETFRYPLGRDFDFAAAFRTDFTPIYESFKEKFGEEDEEKAKPRPPLFPTLLARFLVACAASLKREFASLPRQDSDLPARFKRFTPQVSMLLKYVGILLMAFCTSCGLVYCALLENWLGLDHLLRPR